MALAKGSSSMNCSLSAHGVIASAWAKAASIEQLVKEHQSLVATATTGAGSAPVVAGGNP
jgi:hypothetical protein